jgi:hypothetical protein
VAQRLKKTCGKLARRKKMTIEELRAYVKQQQDKAFGSYLGGMMSWKEAASFNRAVDKVVDLTSKILNMIDYGQEMRPVEPKKVEVDVKPPKEPLTEEELKAIRERNERIKRAFKSYYEKDMLGLLLYEED